MWNTFRVKSRRGANNIAFNQRVTDTFSMQDNGVAYENALRSKQNVITPSNLLSSTLVAHGSNTLEQAMDTLNATVTGIIENMGEIDTTAFDASIGLHFGIVDASIGRIDDTISTLDASIGLHFGIVDASIGRIDDTIIILDDTKAPLNNPTFTGTVEGITKAMVGLDNVDNTADINKPVSTATWAALDNKLSLTGGNLTGSLSTNSDIVFTGTSKIKYPSGTEGQVLTSDGTGNLTLQTPSGGSATTSLFETAILSTKFTSLPSLLSEAPYAVDVSYALNFEDQTLNDAITSQAWAILPRSNGTLNTNAQVTFTTGKFGENAAFIHNNYFNGTRPDGTTVSTTNANPIYCPGSPNLGTETNHLGISMWIKRNAQLASFNNNGSFKQEWFLGQGYIASSGNENFWEISLDKAYNSTDPQTFSLTYNTNRTSANRSVITSSSFNRIDDDVWHHIVVNLHHANNGTNGTINMWLDNVQVMTDEPIAGVFAAPSTLRYRFDLHVGCGSFDSVATTVHRHHLFALNAYYDDIRVFTRPITTIEIDELYNATNSSLISVGAVSLYDMFKPWDRTASVSLTDADTDVSYSSVPNNNGLVEFLITNVGTNYTCEFKDSDDNTIFTKTYENVTFI